MSLLNLLLHLVIRHRPVDHRPVDIPRIPLLLVLSQKAFLKSSAVMGEMPGKPLSGGDCKANLNSRRVPELSPTYLKGGNEYKRKGPVDLS